MAVKSHCTPDDPAYASMKALKLAGTTIDMEIKRTLSKKETKL
jgi:hypothetical protein